jgi:hypothetical protein
MYCPVTPSAFAANAGAFIEKINLEAIYEKDAGAGGSFFSVIAAAVWVRWCRRESCRVCHCQQLHAERVSCIALLCSPGGALSSHRPRRGSRGDQKLVRERQRPALAVQVEAVSGHALRHPVASSCLQQAGAHAGPQVVLGLRYIRNENARPPCENNCTSFTSCFCCD